MTDIQFANEDSRGQAMVRAADALLRTLGPSEIVMILPVVLAPQQGADLGLAAPVAEQVPLSPVVVRELSASGGRHRLELLLSASTVASQMELRNFESADALFDTALGVLRDGRLMRVESVGSDSFAGTPYLYRITVSD